MLYMKKAGSWRLCWPVTKKWHFCELSDDSSAYFSLCWCSAPHFIILFCFQSILLL